MNLLTYPALTQAKTDPAPRVEAAFAIHILGRLHNIAVASGDEGERASWGAVLSHLDCCVRMAKDGQDALRIVLEHPVDLVIAAAAMPRMDGLELSRTLAECQPKTKLILIAKGCDETDHIYLKAGQLYGAAATCTQPLDTEQLLSRVRAILGSDLDLHKER